MLKRIICILLLSSLTYSSNSIAESTLTRDDGILLGLIFRNRVVPASKSPEASEGLKSAVAAASKLGRDGDLLKRYQTMIEAVARSTFGTWNQGIEIATVLDVRTPAKLYKPGGLVKVDVFPVYEYAKPLTDQYAVSINLMDDAGKRLGPSSSKLVNNLDRSTLPINLPGNLASGRYWIEYVLTSHGSGGSPILVSKRSIYVLKDLPKRINMLKAWLEQIKDSNTQLEAPRNKLAFETIEWYVDIYSTGLQEDVAGAYTTHPIFMHESMMTANMAIDRMRFHDELNLAEHLAEALREGDDPLDNRVGDMRLAYRSKTDNELVPFRVYVPRREFSRSPDRRDRGVDPPVVMALHGAGGDENSFMDRYQELYKANANKRGYIAATANGRGPYGGYRDASGQDPLDVLDILQAVYGTDPKRTYLMGHSMGGGGTVSLGFRHPERFAALAPIAGFGNPAQLEKAKDMPIFLGQGEADALVPVTAARAFHEAGEKLGMDFEYVELEGVDHIEIVDLVMDQVFDWFDAHSK
jgi:predicted esterase